MLCNAIKNIQYCNLMQIHKTFVPPRYYLLALGLLLLELSFDFKRPLCDPPLAGGVRRLVAIHKRHARVRHLLLVFVVVQLKELQQIPLLKLHAVRKEGVGRIGVADLRKSKFQGWGEFNRHSAGHMMPFKFISHTRQMGLHSSSWVPTDHQNQAAYDGWRQTLFLGIAMAGGSVVISLSL